MHIWREVNLWDMIDRALQQDYNMDAVVFTMLSTFNQSQSYGNRRLKRMLKF